MNIKDLRIGAADVTIEATVESIAPVREINKYGRTLRIADVTIRDESGTTILTLWNDDVEKVKEGDKIKIENGYVKEWQGQIQLTLGRLGKLSVL